MAHGRRDPRGFKNRMPISDQALEFLEYVEQQPRQSLRQLMDKVLQKSRLMTGAEAGSIFILRRKGRQSWLQAESQQNDAARPAAIETAVPVSPRTIAGYVAATGETVKIDDLATLPPDRPFAAAARDQPDGPTVVSVLCFPLMNYQNEVVGVVELVNRRTKGRKGPVPFPAQHVKLVAPIAQVLANHIERTDMLEQIRAKNAKLRQRNRELAEQRARMIALQAETEDAFMMSIQFLARAAELYDEETGNHILRVNEYSHFLAQCAGMPKAFCDEIRYSAQLHDVGKISVDTAVLKKRGRLNATERADMDRHPLYGHDILSQSPRLQMAADIALYHHEKWDGSGYPNGVAGEEIPMSARIVAIADVYDALRSARPYKPAFSHDKTIRIMLNGGGRIEADGQFDPQLLDIVRARHGELAAIYDRLRD